MVSITDAKQIIRLATDAEIKVFLDGGWGVDALIGYETRRHNDIDIFVEKKDYHKFIQIIKNNGFYRDKNGVYNNEPYSMGGFEEKNY